MSPVQAITAMKERADCLNLARARMSVQMRIILALGGPNACRDVFEAELERLTQGANDNGAWIG